MFLINKNINKKETKIMSRADFEYKLNKKIEASTLYHTVFGTGKKVCDNCNYRGAWSDTCRKFNKK